MACKNRDPKIQKFIHLYAKVATKDQKKIMSPIISRIRQLEGGLMVTSEGSEAFQAIDLANHPELNKVIDDAIELMTQ